MTLTGLALRTVATAAWPQPDDPPSPPALAGFIVSTFSALAAAVADRCLTGVDIPPRTAIVIVSTTGDTVSAEHVAHAVDTGGRVGALLFFQSVPNAVAGHIAARHGLTGPIVCLSPHGEALADARAAASLLIADGDADAALVLWVEQRPDLAHALLLVPATHQGA
jgi:3-oxoacyl-(acyl-carrier-protein) synthase